jgi:glycosyltransferase involved in cell wall biosynthesis
MKKIMFVIHALGYGGAGKMIVYLANHFNKLGYNVVLYVEEQLGKHYDMEPGVQVYQETEFFKNYYTRHFQQIFQLRRRVKEINPDLVISFQTNQNALSVLATRKRHIPVIVSERGDPYQYHDIVAKLKTWVINKAEGGVFQTKKAMQYYGKGLQARSVVIYNPNTVVGIERPVERNNEIAFVGRFDIHQKRQDLAVDAFKNVADAVPDVKLAFYGAGTEQEIIKEKVSRLGLEDRVIFKGLVKDIPNAVKDSRMFLMTSDFEGMPNALIEAMACGLPCVSTDCSPGGANELIRSGENGVIVPCGDAQAIANAMINLLRDPTKAEAMGAEAQKIVEKLSPTNIYGQWENYVQKFLK